MASSAPDKRMDTAPGGEQTQYEGSVTFGQPREKERGHFDDATEATEAWRSEARGEEGSSKEAAAAEHGGEAEGGGEEGGQRSRRVQGYGGGSGVGA